MSELKLVPELYCDDIEITKQFYTDVLGFNIKYQRIAEQFIYFTFDGVDIMVEDINGVGRRWLTAKNSLLCKTLTVIYLGFVAMLKLRMNCCVCN